MDSDTWTSLLPPSKCINIIRPLFVPFSSSYATSNPPAALTNSNRTSEIIPPWDILVTGPSPWKTQNSPFCPLSWLHWLVTWHVDEVTNLGFEQCTKLSYYFSQWFVTIFYSCAHMNQALALDYRCTLPPMVHPITVGYLCEPDFFNQPCRNPKACLGGDRCWPYCTSMLKVFKPTKGRISLLKGLWFY